MKHTINATIRRLSDEEPDALEQEDSTSEPTNAGGWAPWGPDTIQDVYNIISDKLTGQQREIVEAHLMGYNYKDLQVTEKYWRYHFAAAIRKIQKELKL